MTGLDPEDNQQTSQQESASELTTVVFITIQENFLWDLCDNTGEHTFSRIFVMAQVIVVATTPVLFISQRLIHFHSAYGMVFHSCVQRLIECIVQVLVLHLCIWLPEAIELYAIIFDAV